MTHTKKSRVKDESLLEIKKNTGKGFHSHRISSLDLQWLSAIVIMTCSQQAAYY